VTSYNVLPLINIDPELIAINQESHFMGQKCYAREKDAYAIHRKLVEVEVFPVIVTIRLLSQHLTSDPSVHLINLN